MNLNWMSYTFHPCDGYGRVGRYLVRELHRLGVNIHPLTRKMWDGYSEMPGWMQRINPIIDHSNVTVCMMTGNMMPELPGRVWGASMYEADRIPPEWVENIEATCERLFVPCEHNKDVFAGSGVTIPIHVVGYGVSSAEFPLYPPAKHNGTYTFLALGDRGSRKGIATTWGAFYEAFPIDKYPNVRLIVKTRKGAFPYLDASNFDGRVRFWKEDVDNIDDVWMQADCFVFPSYAEGWGLPPREAVAMGVPTIVPRHTGLVVGIDNWATCIIEEFKVQQAAQTPPDGALWYVPDLDETAKHMKWVYENQAEAQAKAQAGGQWLHDNQTWRHAASDLLKLFQEYI